MDLSTYAGLKAAIAAFVNRTDLTDAIPAFIALAEAQMNRRLRTRRMVGRSDAVLIAGDEFVTVPADFLGPIDFVLKTDPQVRLSFLDSQNLLRRKSEESFAVEADPVAYGLVGDEFQLLPVPVTGIDAELTYWKRPPQLSLSNADNWVLKNHPDIYLYGALVQSAPYLADDTRTTLWGTLFTQGIADANAADPLPAEDARLTSDLPRLARTYLLKEMT